MELYRKIYHKIKCESCGESQQLVATPDSALLKMMDDGDDAGVGQWWVAKAEAEGWWVEDDEAIEPGCYAPASFGV